MSDMSKCDDNVLPPDPPGCMAGGHCVSPGVIKKLDCGGSSTASNCPLGYAMATSEDCSSWVPFTSDKWVTKVSMKSCPFFTFRCLS